MAWAWPGRGALRKEGGVAANQTCLVTKRGKYSWRLYFRTG